MLKRKTVKLALLFALILALFISSVSVVFATFQDSGLHNSLISDEEAGESSTSFNVSENYTSSRASTSTSTNSSLDSRAFSEFNNYNPPTTSSLLTSPRDNSKSKKSSADKDQSDTLPVAGAPSPGGNFTGWVSSGGMWFYFIDDVIQTGWLWIGNAWYYLGDNGVMQTGWLLQSDLWYYLNSGGDMQRGWAFVNGRWFFMNPSGIMQTGWLNTAGQTYYLFGDGAMATSWNFIVSEWYFFAEGGQLQRGWLDQGGSRYYLDENGVMARGFKVIDGKEYFFNSSGVMQTGWATINGKDYYFDQSGIHDPYKLKDDVSGEEAIRNGWVQRDGDIYFYIDGQAQKGWFWNGSNWYYFDPQTGIRQHGWLFEGDSWYYLNLDGSMHRGWLFVESEKNWYLMNESGRMMTGTVYLNGKWFLLAPNGVYISEIENPNASADRPSPDNPTKGIDISTWQGDNIDWNAVKDSGIEYVIIRSNFGWTGVDNRFRQNIQGANSVGLKIGVYLYSYATTPAEARLEFENLKRTIDPYRDMINYPIAYDLEDNSAQGDLSVDQLTDIAVTFCDLVSDDGYQPMVYASVSWMERKLDYDRIKDYDLWVAQYNSVCQYENPCNMWQYSSTGEVDGIEGNIDMNWCYGLKRAG